jgi:hypothetical protein
VDISSTAARTAIATISTNTASAANPTCGGVSVELAVVEIKSGVRHGERAAGSRAAVAAISAGAAGTARAADSLIAAEDVVADVGHSSHTADADGAAGSLATIATTHEVCTRAAVGAVSGVVGKGTMRNVERRAGESSDHAFGVGEDRAAVVCRRAALTGGACVAETLVIGEVARRDGALASAPHADHSPVDRPVAAKRAVLDGQRRCGVAKDCAAWAVDASSRSHVAGEGAAVDNECRARDAGHAATAANELVASLLAKVTRSRSSAAWLSRMPPPSAAAPSSPVTVVALTKPLAMVKSWIMTLVLLPLMSKTRLALLPLIVNFAAPLFRERASLTLAARSRLRRRPVSTTAFIDLLHQPSVHCPDVPSNDVALPDWGSWRAHDILPGPGA